MADMFLRPVIEKLIDLLIEESKSLKEVKKQVKSLQNELEIIEPLLRDVEAKSVSGELSDASKVWLRQLREEAEHIEDVIDEYTYYAEQRRQDQAGFVGFLRKAGHCVKTFNMRRGLASEIRDVKESLREIKERGLCYGLRPFEQGGSSGGDRKTVIDPRIGSLFVDENEFVGIESVSSELVSNLVEGSFERMVVSLVGEGGVGKTTLARKVYNDVVDRASFDHNVWITVTQSYDMHKIVKILMTNICPLRGENISIEEAFTLLRSSLNVKRYVIVFDDVWQTDFWSLIKHAFPSNSNGSRIILTTRKSMVVESFTSIFGEMIIKELKTWPKEQAWELFCKKTFPISGCPPELEKFSHEILSKCQGLPLAIVAIAGLLSKKNMSTLEWKKVLDNLNYEFEENRELSRVSRVLLLSYHDLSYNLKSCFLYLGVFPKDFEILESRLYRLWIAEGFIEMRKDKTLDQIAHEYLTELISRNLVSFELEYGSYRVCKVHDLIRELIQKRASDLCFYQLFDQNMLRSKDKCRRLIIYNIDYNNMESGYDLKIRSALIANTSYVSNSFVVGLFKTCKLLKVVDFEKAPLYSLPKEVGNLLHLKLLNLRGSKVKTLPKSIGKLRNLEILDVSDTNVRELPVEINKLRKLGHLSCCYNDTRSAYSVESFVGMRMHEGIKGLEELQTLVRVEGHSGNLIKELPKLSKLKNLGITKVSAEMGEALVESIEKMNKLEKLFISSIRQEEVLDLKFISAPHFLLCNLKLVCQLRQLPAWISELHNLKLLDIHFSRLVEEPLKCLNGLPNLVFLGMYQAYEGDELRFEECSFPKLKELQLRCLEGLKVMKIESGALPLLEVLKIGPFPLMKEIPCGLRNLTNLKTLGVYDMPKEFVSALQPDGGSDHCQIQHISSVSFWYYQREGWFFTRFKLGSSELMNHLEEHH